jgi:Icc protein
MEIDMNQFKEDEVVQENEGVTKPAGDGIDRRSFAGCMARADTGLLWSMVSGVPTSKLLAQTMKGAGTGVGEVEDFSFVKSAIVTSDLTRAQEMADRSGFDGP